MITREQLSNIPIREDWIVSKEYLDDLRDQLSALTTERDGLKADVERLDNAWTECHGLGALVEREKQEALAKIAALEKDFKTNKEINRVLANANADLIKALETVKTQLEQLLVHGVAIEDIQYILNDMNHEQIVAKGVVM